MKKVLKFIRKHKLLVLLGILVIILIIFCAKLVFIFTDSDEVAIYGNRLDAENKAEIKEEAKEKELKEKIGTEAENVSLRVQGRILNIQFNVNNETNRDTAKGIANKALEILSDNEKAYYDIQVFITKTGETEENKQFPIMGYKHHTKDGYTWTKDR